tara:strand:+ start:509 stop:691 length:183 start_codon:yes stop_codon:yes gene_type:complete
MEEIEKLFTHTINNGRTTIKELSPVFLDSAGKRQVVVSADDLEGVLETMEWLKRIIDGER